MQTNGQHSVSFAVACSRMIAPRPAPSTCDLIPVSKTWSKQFCFLMFQEHWADITISNVKGHVQSTTVDFSLAEYRLA